MLERPGAVEQVLEHAPIRFHQIGIEPTFHQPRSFLERGVDDMRHRTEITQRTATGVAIEQVERQVGSNVEIRSAARDPDGVPSFARSEMLEGRATDDSTRADD